MSFRRGRSHYSRASPARAGLRRPTTRRPQWRINIEPALSPHLVVDDAAAAIDFYVKAFGAVELGRVPRPDGKLVHAAVRINGFLVMLNDDFPEMCGGKSMTPKSLGGTPVTIHLTVTDVDAKFQQALDAGATVVAPLDGSVLGRPLRHGRATRSATTGRWGSPCARSATKRSRRQCPAQARQLAEQPGQQPASQRRRRLARRPPRRACRRHR